MIKNYWYNEHVCSEVVNEKISRKILAHDANMMIVEVAFETGGIGMLHGHIHEQITYVLSGAFQFEIKGVKQVIRQGDSIYIEPNAIHGCVCLEKGLLLDIFTPRREDFIKKENVK